MSTGNNNNNSIVCLDDDDIWGDADFIEQAVLLAEQVSTQFSSRYPQPTTIQQPFNFSPPHQLSQRTSHIPTLNAFDSFAPPSTHSNQHHQIHSIKNEIVVRVQKQETTHSVDSLVVSPQLQLDKEHEIETLKKELGRVSNQLNLLEKECSDLRKDRDQKEDPLKDSRVEGKAADKYRENNKNLIHFVPSSTDPGTSRVCPDTIQPNNHIGSWTKSCNSIGVQTDEEIQFRKFRGSQKLLDVWNSCDEERGKILVEKLLTDCGTEISVLFGYITSGIPDESNMISTEHATKLIEYKKVSLLYSEWTKISNEGSSFKDLVKALVDLSSLENVVIVHSSLRILHMALLNSFSLGKNFGKRENVTVEEPSSSNEESEINRCGYSGNETLFLANMTHILNPGNDLSGLRLLSSIKSPGHGGFLIHDRFAESLSTADWVSLFERICQIAISNNDEKIRVEALSIMNLTLTRQNAYLERHEFVGAQLFQNLANLLRKDAGFCVQDLAVHTLHLLCNCPKVVDMLCSGAANHASSSDMNEKISVELWDQILVGLSDCVACSGTATSEELKLRRNSIVFLAFLASSGKSGFEILLNHSLPEDTNFLAIIVRSLISDMELETTKLAQLSNIVREQNLLIREALILLNRLISNQNYSIPVLQALTSTRSMTSMTVDLANRLTRKSSKVVSCQRDGNPATKQILESEVMDLARGFKKRIFTYLGDGS